MYERDLSRLVHGVDGHDLARRCDRRLPLGARGRGVGRSSATAYSTATMEPLGIPVTQSSVTGSETSGCQIVGSTPAAVVIP